MGRPCTLGGGDLGKHPVPSFSAQYTRTVWRPMRPISSLEGNLWHDPSPQLCGCCWWRTIHEGVFVLKIVRFGVQNEAKPEKPMTDGEITATYGLGYSTRICIELCLSPAFDVNWVNLTSWVTLVKAVIWTALHHLVNDSSASQDRWPWNDKLSLRRGIFSNCMDAC